MTLTEMTAHIRKRLKAAGVKARCSKHVICGTQYIHVSVPSVDVVWNADETAAIRHIADCNKLTGARKSPINMTEGYLANVPYAQFSFEYHGG